MSLFDTRPDNACPAYLNLQAAENEFCQAGREHCLDLWNDFEPFADEHFRIQFPVHLHERWFEMYLTVALIRANFDVQCPKPGPDILLTIGNRRIWIEATCASAGEPGRPDSVPPPHISELGDPVLVVNRPTDAMTLRIRNSLDIKARKFHDYVANGIVEQFDITVVAINIHDIPNAWMDMDDLMRRTLYGLGNITVKIDPRTNSILDQGHEHRREISKRSSGNKVNLQPFNDGSLSHISAVLGSSEDVVNRPNRLGDCFGLFPNLVAAIPWLEGTIRLGNEWIHSMEPNGDSYLAKVSYTT